MYNVRGNWNPQRKCFIRGYGFLLHYIANCPCNIVYTANNSINPTSQKTSLAIFLLIENALEGKIWLIQIWFGYYFGEDYAKAISIPDKA
jgi:hypothetical protein